MATGRSPSSRFFASFRARRAARSSALASAFDFEGDAGGDDVRDVFAVGTLGDVGVVLAGDFLRIPSGRVGLLGLFSFGDRFEPFTKDITRAIESRNIAFLSTIFSVQIGQGVYNSASRYRT